MWFALGLVTLAGAAAASGYRRLHPSVPKTPAVTYKFGIGRDRGGRITSVRVAVPARSNLEFEFKRESGFDRFCKGLGIAQEQQIGQRKFDDAIYVISDDLRLRRELTSDQALVDEVLGLFQTPQRPSVSFPITRLRCRDGFLVAEFAHSGSEKDPPTAHMDAVAPVLQRISEMLPQRIGTAWHRDPMFLRSAIVLGASTGLAINGAVQLFRGSLGFLPITVDNERLIAWAPVPAGLLMLAMVVAAIRLLGRSSRLHLVLLEVLLVGSAGAYATSYAELRDANMDFDTKAPAALSTKVADMHFSTGRSNHYYLELVDWNGGPETQRVEVNHADYAATQIDQPMRVVQHPGWLGIRWVEQVTPAAQPNDPDNMASPQR